MATAFNQRKPTFFWQGVLILLPVALMAAFSGWAILRERNAVEQEARQRAKEIMQSLPDDFGRMAAMGLTRHEISRNGWDNYLRGAVAAWPENKNRKEMLANTNESIAITNDLFVLHSALPDWQGGPFPQVDFHLDTGGALLFGGQTMPRPPAWLATLSAGQSQAWADFQAAAYDPRSASNLPGLFKALQETQPPAAALDCAEFVLLRAGLPSDGGGWGWGIAS